MMEIVRRFGDDQPIHSAAKSGQREDVEFALKQGTDVDAYDTTGRTALSYAAQRGHLEIVKLLVEEGANVHVLVQAHTNNVYRVNTCCWGSLHYAACEGHLEVVKFLTKRGAFVHDYNSRSAQPLHVAAEHGHKDVAEFLLKLGADIGNVDKYHYTPLMYAAREGQLEMVNFLTGKGADANFSYEGYNALHKATKCGHKAVEFSLDLGMHVDSHDSTFTPLYMAVREGNLEIVKLLLDRGADFKRKFILHCAAKYDRKDFVEFFLDLGDVNINSCDPYGCTPLHWAAWMGHLDIAKLLVERGANVHSENSDGDQPIHLAADGNVDVVQFFLELGINVDVQNRRGLTPLHAAAKRSSTEVVRLLVENKSSIGIQDLCGMTPLHYAAQEDDIEIVSLLVENNANVNIQDAEGRTPLCHSAMGECSVTVAEHLIYVGANPDITDRNGKTLLHHVIENCRNGMLFLRYILKHQKDVNAKDIDGYTPLSFLIMGVEDVGDVWAGLVIFNMEESFHLLIDAGAYLTRTDFLRIIEDRKLKEYITTNVKLCAQVIVNRFNNHDLPVLYKLHDPSNLPPIENMRIRTNSNVMRELECIFENEIRPEGYYNMDKSPILLTMLSMEVCVRPKTVHDDNEQKCFSRIPIRPFCRVYL